MDKREVIQNKRHEARSQPHEFQFRQEMIPALPDSVKHSQILADYRLRGWNAFQTLSLPSTSQEAWRRTNIRALKVNELILPEDDSSLKLPQPPREYLTLFSDERMGGQIVLYPGSYSEVNLNPDLEDKGVIFTDFRYAVQHHPGILENILGQIVRQDESKFAALVSAFGQNGVLVYIPRGVVVREPLHSLYWGGGVGMANLSHLLVWLEKDASLSYTHEYASKSKQSGQTLHSGIVEIHVGEGANLKFIELQSWGNHVWNFTHERARLEKNANLEWIIGAMGSYLTKSFMDVDLIGEGANAKMEGIYFTDGNQHLDLDTQQNHLEPHTKSDLLFKGALKDHSRSIWQGMIYVAQGAQKADGYQANRNITLSPTARADSIPGLEILTDDVRCTHGVSVGKVDPDQIFYLQSRGIPKEEARRLIVEGFFEPIVQRIPYQGLRDRLQKEIRIKME